MITLTELENYLTSRKKIRENAERVLSRFNEIKDNTKIQGVMIDDVSDFRSSSFAEYTGLSEEGDCIKYHGEERWNYGGYEEHWFELPVALLLLADEELTEAITHIIQSLADEYVKKNHEKILEREKREEERDLKKFEELKKKYENRKKGELK